MSNKAQNQSRKWSGSIYKAKYAHTWRHSNIILQKETCQVYQKYQTMGIESLCS